MFLNWKYNPFKELSSLPEEFCKYLRDRAHGDSPKKDLGLNT